MDEPFRYANDFLTRTACTAIVREDRNPYNNPVGVAIPPSPPIPPAPPAPMKNPRVTTVAHPTTLMDGRVMGREDIATIRMVSGRTSPRAIW